jgi:hypothetical protein
MGAAPAQEGDGLEQAGLAGGVRAEDQVRAGAERGFERGVPAKIERGDRVEQVIRSAA